MSKCFAWTAAVSFTLIFNLAAAQQASDVLSMDHQRIGNVQTRVQKYEHAVGVVNELIRPADQNIDCDGICYTENGRRGVSWACGPQKLVVCIAAAILRPEGVTDLDERSIGQHKRRR